ncbi:hypothetical protein SGRIM119S_06428 [Streptomyces griseorubiginosus]
MEGRVQGTQDEHQQGRAFHVTSAFTSKLTQIANEARRHKYLWSKTEPYYPAKKAAEDGA